METTLTSSKPYLIRAIYEWLADNNLTPYIAVDASIPDVCVPKKFVNDNRIVLNISPIAAHNLRIGNDAIEFQARFGASTQHIFIPTVAVIAIYSRENNRGMVFPQDEAAAKTTANGSGLMENLPISPTHKKKPILKVVKGGKSSDDKVPA
ncbi:MAG: ClpXP protease specificity-enhancing factor [Gammaproteobacteria bacterium]|nr:ClpXP protease specificity-enhancing factor [Gammaproteobacteria bacterium]